MKLYYFDFKKRFRGGSNFGDDLNVWLWDRLAPGLLDDDDRVAFVGIGTLLDTQKLPPENAQHTVIFGSGAGYGEPPKIDDSLTIYCVRGPKTAKALGISQDLVLTDGGILARRAFDFQNVPKTREFAYMPHVWRSYYGGVGWEAVCRRLGFGYIDARWPVERVFREIATTKTLLTEAMHGAIIGDAFRVPWIPARSHSSIPPFKWHDWCESVGVEYQPHDIVELVDPKPETGTIARLRYEVKKSIAAAQLYRLAYTTQPTLSDEGKTKELEERMAQKLEQLRSDAAAGKFRLD